jgi:hypothetical protein
MKRDFELVRKLLMLFEEKTDSKHIEKPTIEGYDESTINYHCRLLNDAGLLRCEEVISSTSNRVIKVIPFELTWDGHEFLNKIKSDSTWEKVKQYSKDKGVVLTFSVVSAITRQWISDQLFSGS